jgi:hypothetical protein
LLAVIVTAAGACGNPVCCHLARAGGLVWAGAARQAIMAPEASFPVSGLAENMMSPTTIPVTIAPEAAERMAELGMQRELERMLDYLRQEVPGVLSVDVQLALPYDTGDETGIVLEVPLDRPWSDATGRRQICDWMVETLSPDANRYFTILTVAAPLPGGDSLLPREAMKDTGVAVTVTAEADQRIADLGMQRELRLMLEHALRCLPGLHTIAVTLTPDYECGGDPTVTVEASVERLDPPAHRVEMGWHDWALETFPFEVTRHFSLIVHEDARPQTHGR